MGYAFRQIKAALNAEDPEGLLAMGAPADEYESEASLIEARIAPASADKLDVGQIADIVAEVWNDRFGPFDADGLNKRHNAFSSVARRLLAQP